MLHQLSTARYYVGLLFLFLFLQIEWVNIIWWVIWSNRRWLRKIKSTIGEEIREREREREKCVAAMALFHGMVISFQSQSHFQVISFQENRTGSLWLWNPLILTFGRLESSLWVPEVDVNDWWTQYPFVCARFALHHTPCVRTLGIILFTILSI